MNILLSSLVALNFYVRTWYAFSAVTRKLLPSLSPDDGGDAAELAAAAGRFLTKGLWLFLHAPHTCSEGLNSHYWQLTAIGLLFARKEARLF